MLKETPKKFPPKHIYNAFETMAGSAISLAEYILKFNPNPTKTIPPEIFYQISLAMYFLGILLNKEDFEPCQVDLSSLVEGERREILKKSIIDLGEELKKEL
jgi:hypothetical protein